MLCDWPHLGMLGVRPGPGIQKGEASVTLLFPSLFPSLRHHFHFHVLLSDPRPRPGSPRPPRQGHLSVTSDRIAVHDSLSLLHMAIVTTLFLKLFGRLQGILFIFSSISELSCSAPERTCFALPTNKIWELPFCSLRWWRESPSGGSAAGGEATPERRTLD